MNNLERIAVMEQQLITAFQPTYLTIQDDSAKHHGHVGAQSGAGHFSISISASAFDNLSLVDSHRLIYQALDNLMGKDIHALQIKILKNAERL